MADTTQNIKWALKRSCPMRHGENWADPDVTFRQLKEVNAYSWALKNDRVLNDVCITLESRGRKHQPPELYGFLISATFAQFGGTSAVENACQNCEANVQTRPVKNYQLAGCAGSFYVFPSDEQLEKIIQENHLEDEFKNSFLQTSPKWFGLWTESPLNETQLSCLHTILSQLSVPEKNEQDVERFIKAIETAIQQGLELHVSMNPRGHLDLGLYTVWSHCPRCRAAIYPPPENESAIVTCRVCQYEFEPEPTQSREFTLHELFGGQSLEKILDDDAYSHFLNRYLEKRGYSAEEIEEMFTPSDVDRVQELINAYDNEEIAKILNKEGRQTRRGAPYSAADIHNLCHRYSIKRKS